MLYNINAAKKSVNLSVNSSLLEKAREMNANISALLEEALRQQLAKAAAQEWAKEHGAAIQKYNEIVGEIGCFSDDMKSF